MIKINLLREPKKAKAAPWKAGPDKTLLAVIGVAAVLVLGLMAWYWSLSSSVEDIRARRQALEQEKAQLDQVLLQIEQTRRDNEELERRVSLVQRLRNNQSTPIRLLNGLLASIPTSPKLWLTGLEEKQSEVKIEGRSFDVPAIADFIGALNRQRVFSGVELVFWEEDGDDIKFELKAVVEE